MKRNSHSAGFARNPSVGDYEECLLKLGPSVLIRNLYAKGVTYSSPGLSRSGYPGSRANDDSQPQRATPLRIFCREKREQSVDVPNTKPVGFAASSRWLSGATPPDYSEPLLLTPEG